jgi:hypothetical protein
MACNAMDNKKQAIYNWETGQYDLQTDANMLDIGQKELQNT